MSILLSAEERHLLELLVAEMPKNEIGVPQWRGLNFMFFDKFKDFENFTRDEYKEMLLSMIAKDLILYDNNGYFAEQIDRWTISASKKGLIELLKEREKK